MPKQIEDMEIDEISLVDRPANQHALVTIAKRAPKEDIVPDMFYDQQGDPVDENELNFGDHVFDADGQEYILEPDDEDNDEAAERELADAGVSKAFSSDTEEYGMSILEELAKAVTDSDRDQVIAKALGQNVELAKRLEAAEQLATNERTLRLEREYIEKAAEYNVPIEPESLGPVLMRMAETMSFDDCAVIHKALTSAGEILYSEAGFQGQADNDDPLVQVERIIDQAVSKSEGQVSKSQAMTEFFVTNPDAYDAYRQEMRG